MARPYYFHHKPGRNVAEGQVIKHLFSQGGNTHTYMLRALFPATLGNEVDWGNFEIANPNPTTFRMTTAQALSIPARLQPGDKLLFKDTGGEYVNNEGQQIFYSQLAKTEKFAGQKAVMIFDAGENELKTYELHNEFQQQLPETYPNVIYRSGFNLQFLNAPVDFHGYIRVENKTEFENIRVTYPVQEAASVEIEIVTPASVGLTATFDTGSSYTNGRTINDFFYIEYSRAFGSNLILTKHPLNTIP